MSAAVEAGVEGLQAIGFSLLDFSWDADFSQAKTFIQSIVKSLRKSYSKRNCVECKHSEITC